MININTKSFADGLNNTHSLPQGGASQQTLDTVTKLGVKRGKATKPTNNLFFLTMQNKNNCCC